MKTTITSIAFIVIAGVILSAYIMNSNKATESVVLSESAQRSADEFSKPLASDFLEARPEIAVLPKQDISASEKAALLQMREEEKLAHDVYTTLGTVWGVQVFANIAQSEQTHTEAMRALLEKYTITDPSPSDVVGVYSNPTFTKLYNDLVAKGSVSIEEGLTVGALIEDLDIADLEKFIKETDNEDIKLVYGNLTRASRNHLRSFTAQLGVRGLEYVPTYITAEEYKSIISTPKEQGTGAGHGNGGQGGGRGSGMGI